MNTPINSVGVNGGYAGYVSPQTTKTATQTNQKSISGSGTDEVTLSSNEAVGRRLSELLGFPTLEELSQMQSPGSSGVIRLEDLRAAYAEAFEEFQERLGGLLEEAGVDRSELARLRSDATGRIFVANDHPDKAAIEQLFEDNPELAKPIPGAFRAVLPFGGRRRARQIRRGLRARPLRRRSGVLPFVRGHQIPVRVAHRAGGYGGRLGRGIRR